MGKCEKKCDSSHGWIGIAWKMLSMVLQPGTHPCDLSRDRFVFLSARVFEAHVLPSL